MTRPSHEKRLLLVLSAALALTLEAAAAELRAEEDEQILEVPVFPGPPWAQKATPLAEDPLQAKPEQATVYDEEAIRDARIEDIDDLVNLTPGLQISGLTDRLTIRGIGRLQSFTAADTPVGVYIDDVFIRNPAAYNFDFFDAARVEVLRGPQGYDGGQSSVAGAIRFYSAPPLPENTGGAEVSLGNFDLRQVRSHINVTSEDGRVSNRLATTFTKRDGTVRNRVDGERINDRDDWGLRNQTAFALGPGVNADLTLDYAKFTPVLSAAGEFDSVLDGDVDIFNNYTEKRQLYGGAFRVNKEGQDLDVTSITAARGFKFDSSGSNFSAQDLLRQDFGQRQATFSQELRFSGSYQDTVDWTFGPFLYVERLDQDATVELTGLAPVFGLMPGHAETSDADETRYSTALFGETTWHLTEELNFFAGLRGSYDRTELDYNYSSNDGIAVLAPIQSIDDSANFTSLGWRLGFSYDITPTASPYVLVSQISKPGGFNNVQLASDFEFDKETATNYELGIKSTWFEGALVANAAVFILEVKDQQVQNVGVFGAPTVNADKARSKGVELSLAGRPSPGLDLFVGYTYTDAEFVDFDDFPATGGGTQDLSGNELPFAPEHAVTFGVNYVRPLVDDIRFVARSDYAYQSSFFFDPENDLKQSGYGLLSARVGFESDRWGIYGWGKNLTDEDYRTSALVDATSGALAIAGDPRTYGVELRYRF